MKSNLHSRITMLPDICIGKPTIRGMSYLVEMILDLLSAGMTVKELKDDYPGLEEEDVRACLQFASQLVKVNSISQVVVS